ncbi:ISL LIM homeobox 1b [Alosa sapidissima]|uniref:ISL LIM homeobox 1b n=1 Tax=Alosa sapidissima TaxID=34773 RepID=UPI001C0A3D65|nr:ISL LIM homeobox 1b [Alosa sapidissima]
MEYPQKTTLNWESAIISSCAGCGHQILDRFFLRVFPDMEWHTACLKCAECKKSLDGAGTCFVKDGRTLCKEDYYRLYGINCGKCKKVFSKDDLVMRTCKKIYHFDCFRCESCNCHLLPGDEFHMRDGHLLCTAEHDVFETPTEERNGHSENISNVKELSHLDVGSLKRTPTPLQRTTRVRTVLSKKQLHMLQTCYSANPRPDALVKEQLVEMTGLSSRVIRVWFQNKRCKDKKRSTHPHITPIQTTQKDKTEKALETICPDSPMDFLRFQQSWKIMNELTLHTDCDDWLVTSSSGEADSKSLSSQLLETPCSSLVSSPVSSGIH